MVKRQSSENVLGVRSTDLGFGYDEEVRSMVVSKVEEVESKVSAGCAASNPCKDPHISGQILRKVYVNGHSSGVLYRSFPQQVCEGDMLELPVRGDANFVY